VKSTKVLIKAAGKLLERVLDWVGSYASTLNGNCEDSVRWYRVHKDSKRIFDGNDAVLRRDASPILAVAHLGRMKLNRLPS